MGLEHCERHEGDAVAALLRHSRFPDVARDYLAPDDPEEQVALVHHGDLHIDGDLVLPYFKQPGEYEPIHLVVLGDLVVRGRFTDNDDPASSVLVTGDLRADLVFTSGRLEVGGDVEAGMVIGDYDDHRCQIGGTLRCGVYWSDEHPFAARTAEIEVAIGPELHLELSEGEVECVTFPDQPDGDERAAYDLYRRFFVDDLLYHEPRDDQLVVALTIRTTLVHRRVVEGLPIRPDRR